MDIILVLAIVIENKFDLVIYDSNWQMNVLLASKLISNTENGIHWFCTFFESYFEMTVIQLPVIGLQKVFVESYYPN